MRNRLLQGVHTFFTSYVWMISGIWLFSTALNIILGLVIFPETYPFIWHVLAGTTLGYVIGMVAVTILKLVFNKQVVRTLRNQDGFDA